MQKRCFDIIFALIASVFAIAPVVVIWLIVASTSQGSAIYWSRRAGRQGRFFMMPKFRSMRIDTPEVATDKLGDANSYITPFGSFLRRTSLDELPQIYSVLRGDRVLLARVQPCIIRTNSSLSVPHWGLTNCDPA